MRLPDWQILFAKFLKENANSKFEWGVHDCCLFSANCVLAITGTDYASSFRGTYSNERDAYRLIKQYGSIEALVTTLTGIKPVNGRYADVGDIVLVLQEGRELLAVCNGQTMFAPGANSLITLETKDVLKTWKV